MIIFAIEPLFNDSVWVRVVHFGIPSVLIVFGSVFYELKKCSKQKSNEGGIISKLGIEMGNSSYSLYLSHIFILGAMRVEWNKVWVFEKDVADFLAFSILATLLCVIGATVVNRIIELPSTAFFQSIIRKISTKNVEFKTV